MSKAARPIDLGTFTIANNTTDSNVIELNDNDAEYTMLGFALDGFNGTMTIKVGFDPTDSSETLVALKDASGAAVPATSPTAAFYLGELQGLLAGVRKIQVVSDTNQSAARTGALRGRRFPADDR